MLQWYWQVLANIFKALLSSKAHWYQIRAPTSEEPQHLLIHSIFPSLMSHFSLDDNFAAEFLVLLGLAWYKKGNYSLLLTAWEKFIMEFKLMLKLKHFQLVVSSNSIF